MSNILDQLINSNNIVLEDIHHLIENKEKESLFLEYKSGEWLQNNGSGKFKLRKWVSSFANSAGGILIIGVTEKEENDERYPDVIDGIDLTEFKENIGKWIEDALKEKIYPRLNPPPEIITFQIKPDIQRIIALIRIQQTNFYIHKVTEKGKEIYFHRHNFQVLSMDEWEIRTLLFGRNPPPILELDIEKIYVGSSSDHGRTIKSYVIDFKIENLGWQIAEYLQFGIIRPLGDFESMLNLGSTAEIIRNQKHYLADSLINFFDIENQNELTIDTIALVKPNFLHPYDSIKIFYKLKNMNKFPIYDVLYFGVFILAKNLVRPEIYGVKILYLGEDEKPEYSIYNYNEQKIKILSHKE